MSSEVREMMAEYKQNPWHTMSEDFRRRRLLDITRGMAHDHRYNLDTRLACMAQMLDDNREVWSNA